MFSRIFDSSVARSQVTTMRRLEETSVIISLLSWNTPRRYSHLSFSGSLRVASAEEYIIAAIAENVSGFEGEVVLPAIINPVLETMETL